MSTQNTTTNATTPMTWTEAMKNWKPIYDYERPLTPYLSEIIEANLTPAKLRMVESYWPGRNWTHDATQNIMTIPEHVQAAERARRKLRETRKENNRWSPTRHRAGMALHVRISERQPGTFLARQKKIEYAILLHAHRSPGLSMTDNLRRSNHPTCTRLANA